MLASANSVCSVILWTFLISKTFQTKIMYIIYIIYTIYHIYIYKIILLFFFLERVFWNRTALKWQDVSPQGHLKCKGLNVGHGRAGLRRVHQCQVPHQAKPGGTRRERSWHGQHFLLPWPRAGEARGTPAASVLLRHPLHKMQRASSAERAAEQYKPPSGHRNADY